MAIGGGELGASPPPKLPGTPPGYFIQSLLNNKLVIDIKGGKDDPGAPLQVFAQKLSLSPSGQALAGANVVAAANQLWNTVLTSSPRLP
jgi:hypothetical protein